MDNPWLARFADEPALVAPHLRDRFESSLVALGALFELPSRVESAADGFWTELGPHATRRFRPYVVENGVLLIPVKGVLLHAFPYQFFDYATGYEYIGEAFKRGIEDDEVRGIALIIDSPGGMVAGNFDLVDAMFAGRGTKPVRAYAAESAYSAAYSIASAADTIIMPRTGGVGSIGVVTSHVDVSKSLGEAGIKVTFIYAGAHKVDGNAFEPLPDEVKARIQERVDELYGIFVDTVARNRNLDAAAVRATEALTFTATEAVANGLADKVGALDGELAAFAADLLNPDEGDETMSDTKPAMTVASAKADYPDVANALIEEGKSLGKAEAKADFDAQLTGDRTRIAALDALQVKMGNHPKAVEIIAAAKADGSTAADTALKLIEAGVTAQTAAAVALAADEEGARGANPAGSTDGNKAKVPQTPEGWKAEWEGSEKLQNEFPTADAYVADRKYEQRKNGGAK